MKITSVIEVSEIQPWNVTNVELRVDDKVVDIQKLRKKGENLFQLMERLSDHGKHTCEMSMSGTDAE